MSIDLTRRTPLPGFAKDIETLSVYLSQYIIGREFHEEPTQGAPILNGWKIVGRRGECVRLPLDLQWSAAEESILDYDEDLGEVEKRWRELPRWMQDAMRIKHPHLRKLP